MRFLDGFLDELTKTGGLRPSAKDEDLVRRALGWGALTGAGVYSGKKLLAAAGAGEDPAYSGDTLVGSTAKSALGAAMAAGALRALSRMHR